ncbi:hypothetical protein GE061_009765 [Apolygus lucorum]|uniref:DUF4461 domain-containing protein n=1 Tax=Apolygus lucorum TaxID=248454 RepID=A0A8S9Y1F1_APOLU|nr:hypothetical protein GE061_009765 [Apolygus lucorum]
MEYQHCAPRGTTETKREEEDEPFTVGTVTVSERRKPVVINNESCATATLTAFPSTSPGTTAVPLNPVLVNEVGNNQPEVVTAPTTPATPVETSLPEQADGNTATPATLAASEFSEQSLATPAAPAQQTAKLPNEVGTPAQRSAVVDNGLPAVPTATPVATTTVEVAVAAPAMPDMLTATSQDHSMTFTEPAVADVAAPEMMTVTAATPTIIPHNDELASRKLTEVEVATPATLPATLSPATQTEIWANIVAQVQATMNQETRQSSDLAVVANEDTEEDENMEEDENSHSILEHPEEWELIPTDQWDEPKPAFDDEESVTPLEEEVNGDDQLDDSELFPRKNMSCATPPAQSSDPVTGVGVPGDVSCEEDEDFVDALAHQPQELRTVPVPIKEEPDDVTTASTPDQEQEEPGHSMNQQQLEQAIGIEGDPPFDEYVQQVLDTFQEEAEAYESIPMDHVTTPEPCDAPQTTLAGIVNCIRYAAMGDIRMTRVSNGYIAVVAMLRVARWVPQYRRIAQERDHLLEQREELRTERAKLLRERAAAWKENQVLKAALGVEIAEPPAARTVTSSPPHRTSTPIDQIPEQTHAIPEPQVPEPGADEPREMATVTRGSPVASTSRARSITPNSSARRSPTQPISPFREPAMALRNATRKGGRMPLPPSSSSASEEERPGVPNHGGGPEVEVGVCPESPRTVPKLILKRFKSSAAKQHKTHKKIRCPICKKHCSQLVAFRCYACKDEAGPMMLSPTGQFILPCSCPSFLLVSFISENMGRASELINKYMKEKYIERELHQKCLESLDIITLDKDDCITPQKMIVCCTALYSKSGELKEFLKGTRVTSLEHMPLSQPWCCGGFNGRNISRSASPISKNSNKCLH